MLSKYIPNKYITKVKRGFSIPLADWLRGPLKDWAEEILSDSGEHSVVEEKTWSFRTWSCLAIFY